MYLPFPKSCQGGFLLPIFLLPITFHQRQDADSASSLHLFRGCKDSVARLHLHFYHCLLNLNNLSCSSQPPHPVVLQNQSEALDFVIKLILEVPAISHRLLTPSLFCCFEVWGKTFFLTDQYILVRFVRDFFVYACPFQSV